MGTEGIPRQIGKLILGEIFPAEGNHFPLRYNQVAQFTLEGEVLPQKRFR